MVTLEEIKNKFESSDGNITSAFWETVDALELGTDKVGVNEMYFLDGILEEDDLEVWAVNDGKVIIFNWSVEEGSWEALDIEEWLEGVEGFIGSHGDDFSEFDRHWVRG